MPEDKVIKSGQLTLPRLVFLAACGGVLFIIVAYGLLNIGYLLLTAVLCGLLLLIAMDYGVNMEKVDLSSNPAQAAAAAQAVGLSQDKPASTAVRVQPARRRPSRAAKRRR
jgi:hypothetical protein